MENFLPIGIYYHWEWFVQWTKCQLKSFLSQTIRLTSLRISAILVSKSTLPPPERRQIMKYHFKDNQATIKSIHQEFRINQRVRATYLSG